MQQHAHSKSIRPHMRIKAIITCALMVLCSIALLSGCQGNNYEKAKSLFENGQYVEAEPLLEELGDYEDSADMLLKCRYELAKASYEAGDYEAAVTAFEVLQGYEDAPARLAEAKAQVILLFWSEGIE